MVTDPRGIRLRLLAVVAVVVAGVAWVVLKLVVGSGKDLPDVSWLGVAIFVVIGAALLLVGWPVKRLVEGTNTKPVNPLYAARVLAMAQAAALAGAVVLGWYLAQLAVVLPDVDVPSQHGKAVLLGALGVAAAGVGAVGLVVQGWCRINDSDRPGRSGATGEELDGRDGSAAH